MIRNDSLFSFDTRIATLLQLSREEYQQIRHSGIREITDSDGNVISYCIKISPVNEEHLLHKLNIDKGRTIYFAPEILSGQSFLTE